MTDKYDRVCQELDEMKEAIEDYILSLCSVPTPDLGGKEIRKYLRSIVEAKENSLDTQEAPDEEDEDWECDVEAWSDRIIWSKGELNMLNMALFKFYEGINRTADDIRSKFSNLKYELMKLKELEDESFT